MKTIADLAATFYTDFDGFQTEDKVISVQVERLEDDRFKVTLWGKQKYYTSIFPMACSSDEAEANIKDLINHFSNLLNCYS